MSNRELRKLEDTFRECREPFWLHYLISRTLLLISWIIVQLFWGIWLKVEGQLPQDERGGLVLATHRSMFDAFIIGSLQPLSLVINHFERLLWFVPERTNYMFYRWFAFFINHLKCLPVKRADKRDVVSVRTKIKQLARAGGYPLLFPGGGRERLNKPLRVDPAVGRLVHELGVGLPVYTIQINGMPIWHGSQMSGNRWQRLKQFSVTFFKQLLLRQFTLTISQLEVDDLRRQPLTTEVKQRLAERIEAAVRPKFPVHPLADRSFCPQP